MVTDGCGKHFIMYRITDPLCCTPKTCQLYTSLKNIF